MLTIEHFTKKYDQKLAVDDLTLSVEAGHIVGFIGHNGAGKTTTIKSIVGLLPIEEGSIMVNGVDVAQHPQKAKQDIAYIPDNPDLYEFMTANQYVSFVGQVYGVELETLKQRVVHLADVLGLTENMNDSIHSFSHGMKQKVALIAAFCHEPKLILLDEPFVGLDPQASFHLKQLMKEACDKGAAIFFSTHVLEVAEKLCDEVAIIRQGKLVLVGKTTEVIGDESLEDVFLELSGESHE